MNDIIKLNGVSVDVEEARKAVAEFDAKQAEDEKLIGRKLTWRDEPVEYRG